MKSKLTSGLIIISVMAFSSCVSSKKYKASEEKVSSLTSQLSSCNTNVASANAKAGDLSKQVSTLTATNQVLAGDAAKYKAMKAEKEMNKQEMDASLAGQGTSMNEIQTKLVEGLGALIDSGIDVTYKEGLLHIQLPEKMLFKTGSAVLGKSSKAELSPMASVLNQYPKVQIYVIGHSDTMKIHTAKFEDNWALSTERANSIVRALIKDYAVAPSRILSAGRSKFSPIASNDTKVGKAANRRIEIILNPGLIKLFELAAETGN